MESLGVPSPQTLAQQLRELREHQITCNLRVYDGWREGALRVERGEVSSSSFGELSGAAALDAMLALGEGLRFELLPSEPVSRGAEESMVVPISTWSDAPAAPAPAALDEGTAPPIAQEHGAIVIDEGATQARASTPPTLELRTDEAPSAEPARASSATRVWIGVTAALALLCAILLARSLEQQSPSAAHSGEAEQHASTASATAQPAPRTQAAPPPSAASPFEPHAAPIAPAGALAPTIPVRVLIGPEGRVKQTELVARRDGFAAAEEQALELARGFRFQAQAGDTWLTVPVRFRPTPPTRHVSVKGSDTLGVSLIPAWAEALRRSQPQVQVEVESLGTTPGLAALLDGSADVAAASRLIRADELALTEKLGMQLREVYVGYDAVALIVHPSNAIATLDMDAIARIFTDQVQNWSELGGPNLPIHAVGRPGYSGTHRFFKERVLTRLGPDTGFGATVAMFEQGRDVAAEVARDPGAIGYVSFTQAQSDVRIVPLTGASAGETLKPTAASVRDGSYPLARALVMYLRPDSGTDAHALVDFALSAQGQEVLEKQGFVPLPVGMSAPLGTEPDAPAAARGGELIRIYFEPNSVAVAQDSRADLNAAGLRTRANRSVIVVGNADASGDAEANRRLAQRRAEQVARKLRELGSRDATITVQVAAADHPIASNQTSDGRRANRRVDVIIR